VAIVIGAISASMSLIGLELCSKTGACAGERGDLGGLVLIGIGIAAARGIV
jgi:putative Mn2+ efflux pump MntP